MGSVWFGETWNVTMSMDVVSKKRRLYPPELVLLLKIICIKQGKPMDLSVLANGNEKYAILEVDHFEPCTLMGIELGTRVEWI